ncbi:hypothetical protein, partial [Vibrio anguillarum]|uniref:hypothetical protein n=1 Tax=Vibrio anguillarum TaxID=55601 RepID=UPI00188AE516
MIELTGGQALLIVELGEYAEILHWGQKVSGDLNGYHMGSASSCILTCHDMVMYANNLPALER